MSLKNKTKLFSIIIRTKNEEKWIEDCILSIYQQSYKNFEIIIVDNNSKDRTVDICKKYNLKVININKFKPGDAINKGIENSDGNYIVILSAHCIPATKDWLLNFVKKIKKRNVAGVYGRQIPLKNSSDKTKRDLFITFGSDEKIKKKDPFFHNANSCIKKNIWKKIKFDNFVTNIEDRIWADKILQKGFEIVYTPDSPVYHFHGIHHDDKLARLKTTVKILDKMTKINLKNKINKINLRNKYD